MNCCFDFPAAFGMKQPLIQKISSSVIVRNVRVFFVDVAALFTLVLPFIISLISIKMSAAKDFPDCLAYGKKKIADKLHSELP